MISAKTALVPLPARIKRRHKVLEEIMAGDEVMEKTGQHGKIYALDFSGKEKLNSRLRFV